MERVKNFQKVPKNAFSGLFYQKLAYDTRRNFHDIKFCCDYASCVLIEHGTIF